MYSVCIHCARAAVTKSHNLGGLNNRNSLSHRFGGQKSEVKVSRVFHAPLATSLSLAIFGVPRLVEASAYLSPLRSPGILPVPLSLQSSHFYDISHVGLEPTQTILF